MTAFAQGDIVYLDFDPQAGHEQKGRRPAVIVSNADFQRRTGLALVCPITNTRRGYPLHIALDARTRVTGVIMCEQVKALDVAQRNAEFVDTLPRDILEVVREIVRAFL